MRKNVLLPLVLVAFIAILAVKLSGRGRRRPR